jgi:hypothetical protein
MRRNCRTAWRDNEIRPAPSQAKLLGARQVYRQNSGLRFAASWEHIASEMSWPFNNPRGLGGLRARPQDRFAIGTPGNCCGAKSKQNGGKPCKQPPNKGSKRCRFHGGAGSGRGRVALPKNLRQAHSKAIALARKAARAELEVTTLHPETLRVFARLYREEIYEANTEMFLLALNQQILGEISVIELKAVLALARERR